MTDAIPNRIPRDTRTLELYLGTLAIAWGMFVLGNAIFADVTGRESVFDRSPGLAWLAAHGDQWQYGVIALALGVLKVWLAMAYRVTWLSAILDATFWTWFVAGIALIHLSSTGVVTYGWIVLGNLYLARYAARRGPYA